MPRFDESYPEIVASLADRYGRPSASVDTSDPFASVVLSFLERTIDARKAALVVESLREAGFVDPRALAEADPSELSELLKAGGGSAGQKAIAPLKRIASVLAEHGPPESWADLPTAHLREELLSLKGVGPSSADAVLLFGLDRASYPVDRPTYRVLVRHGWLDPSAEYDEARDVVERPTVEDAETLRRFSAWMERIGKDYCRLAVAHCEKCPLRPFLPEGGPLGDEGG